jgi:hypothetical protein
MEIFKLILQIIVNWLSNKADKQEAIEEVRKTEQNVINAVAADESVKITEQMIKTEEALEQQQQIHNEENSNEETIDNTFSNSW